MPFFFKQLRNLDGKTRRLVIFFASTAGFVLVLIFGTSMLLKFIPAEAPRAPTPIPTPVGNQEKGTGTKSRITNDAGDTRPIIYAENGFTPTAITVYVADSIGCLISVINKTDRPLKVGVSPHDPAGDPGANYGIIQPGGTGIMDPRYPGLTEVGLHDHNMPEHELRVHYGLGCH